LDLSRLRQISRGDRSRSMRYLRQFQELIPARLELLELARYEEDRKTIRQVVHQMRPQLEFFGLAQLLSGLQLLEVQYRTMAWEKLTGILDKLKAILLKALQELIAVLQFLHDHPLHTHV
ncbi:MAG: hypothetical protein AAFU60_19040, partial [Bacteroidota bacterium]